MKEIINTIKIQNPSEIFGKYIVSWGGTFMLTIGEEYKPFLPVATQIALLLFSQTILFGFDFARLKFLNERRKRTIKQVDDKIEVLEEKIEEVKENQH